MISISELWAIRTIIRLIGLFVATVFPGVLKALGTVGCFNGKWSTCLTSSWPWDGTWELGPGVSIGSFHNATGVIGRQEGRDILYFSIAFIFPGVLLKIKKYGSTSISCFPCCFVQLLSHVWLCDPWTTATKFLYPQLSSGGCSNSCPLSQRCYLTISSSAVPFSICLQSFLASGSFPMSQLFASGGQSIGASASAAVLAMNTQGWFPLGLTYLVSLQISLVFT